MLEHFLTAMSTLAASDVDVDRPHFGRTQYCRRNGPSLAPIARTYGAMRSQVYNLINGP